MSTHLPPWGQPDPFGKTPPRVTQRVAEVTQHEVQAARELLQDYGLARPSLAAAIAAALADARDGATIPGRRLQVEATVYVSGDLWRRSSERDYVEASARARLRREWADQLDRKGLRPLTWPAPEVSFQRWTVYCRPGEPGIVDCAEDEADQVTLRLHGLAVAL